MTYVALYLVAIVAANLTVAAFGPNTTIINAFVLIGLDLTARDNLHDAWHGRGLAWKMAALIGAGSALSWLINRDAGQIALASMLAFGAAAVADTLVYQILRERAHMVKVNGSNVISAAVDSMIFPTVAFGGFMPAVVLGQLAAKVLGGLVWSMILRPARTGTRVDKLSKQP
ncbi:VUT family protein [Casimicrobium huifangae]|uniref:VUT family protein n=1 Tax=Casimicrobium huifangae TaxID=2591109 RepID=UPI00378328E9